MSKYYANWHGGSNYAVGGMESIEEFDSILHMVFTCEERYRNSNGQTPNVDSNSQMWCWKYDPREVIDPYPDFLLIPSKNGIYRKVNA